MTIVAFKDQQVAALKMIAYQDRPYERVRDLSDLAYLIEEFLPEDDPRRFSNEAFQFGLSYEATSPEEGICEEAVQKLYR